VSGFQPISFGTNNPQGTGPMLRRVAPFFKAGGATSHFTGDVPLIRASTLRKK